MSVTRTDWWRGVALVGVLGLVLLFILRSREPAFGGIDLVDQFPEAEKRTTLPSLHQAFGLLEVTIDGETRPSILAHAASRIIWRVEMPPDATLEVSVAMRPDTWTLESDGVIFRIGISDGQEYTELFRQRLAPYDLEADRRWFPVTLDLSPYGGRLVEVIFNTDSGAVDNNANDAAIWGAPRIVAPS